MALCEELQHVWAQKSSIRPNTRLVGMFEPPFIVGKSRYQLGPADLLVSLCCVWMQWVMEGWSEWVSNRKVQGTRGSESSAAEEGVWAQCELAVHPRAAPERPHGTSMAIPGAGLQEEGTSPAVPEKPHASSCSEVDGCLFVLC